LGILSFFIKAAIIIGGILLIIGAAMKEKAEDRIVVKDLNKRFKSYRQALLNSILDKKKLKKETKEQAKADKKADKDLPRTFVIDFKGDMKASAVDELRETITATLSVATKDDEVVVTLESPGGMVHGYGLAASQLQRIKDAGIPFTVCVDKVAASGGYMMACLADKIIAAPFSIVGSVGVVAGVPNFNKLLKKNNVDYYQVTSGKFKRTVSLLGEVTDEGLHKFKEEIEETHVLFKEHIKRFRPQVDVEKISTGEHWYGQVALGLKLVDELGTSDAYLWKRAQDRAVKQICFQAKKTFKDKMAEGLAHLFNKSYDSVNEKLSTEQLQ
jgi:serine protease SohB